MLRKIVAAVILIPLAIVLIGFAVANRQAVTVSFDPFNAGHPAYAVTLPLFGIVFVLVIIGVIIGGIASWLGQHHWRRAARHAEADNRALTAEVMQLRRRLEPFEHPDLPPHAGSAPPASLHAPGG